MDDDVLYACIEEAVEEEARARYLPLAGRLELRNRLVNAFRRLDILQELVDNPEITEIMINGKDQILWNSMVGFRDGRRDLTAINSLRI